MCGVKYIEIMEMKKYITKKDIKAAILNELDATLEDYRFSDFLSSIESDDDSLEELFDEVMNDVCDLIRVQREVGNEN